MNKRILISLFLLFFFIFFLAYLNWKKETLPSSASTIDLGLLNEDENTMKFKKAVVVQDFEFPKDYGAHPEYMTEWWYYTGNVFTEDGRHFGYQLTFFRRALTIEQENTLSDWSSQQIYLAHFAITNSSENEHIAYDQISREAVGLAGTSMDPYFSIWLKNWEINQINENQFTMKAKTEEISIDFLLSDQKGEVFHGKDGLSRKGEGEGNASYYFSQTRLETQGTLFVNETQYNVTGYSWMDHEFGTSTLSSNQVGWDWFSIQLDNDMEIMLFQIRDENGEISPFSSGTIIDSESKTTNLTLMDFEIQPTKIWKTTDQFEYPASWEISIENENISLSISPTVNDQELKLFFRYWEGAVVINGFIEGKTVNGFGYVELTGYAQSMQGVF